MQVMPHIVRSVCYFHDSGTKKVSKLGHWWARPTELIAYYEESKEAEKNANKVVANRYGYSQAG